MMRRKILALGVVALAISGAATPGSAETTAEKRLRILEQQLQQTQEEIQNLRRELRETKTIGQKQAQDSRDALATAQKSFSIPDWVNKFSLFGDLRIRHEGFYHRPAGEQAGLHARNRERFRARVGLKFTYSEELSATVRLASGNPDDPISTNETFTGTFTGKRVHFDWAYMTLTPGKTFGWRPGVFAISAGKMPNPFFRTDEMVFDDDLSGEGFAETVQVLGAPMGALDQIKIHAVQWTFNEVQNGQDGWLFGGQINPQMHVGTTQIEAGLGQYGYLNVDQIAQALTTNSALANTNLLDGDGNFDSGFMLTDVALAVIFPNVVGTQPVKVWTHYVHNWDATNDDAHGGTFGVKFGQTKTQGDWAFATFYEYIQQEAALSTFTYSDFGPGGTNQMGPVVGLEYQLLNPLTVSVKNHFTNYIRRPDDTTNPTLFRLQLDALLKF